MRAFDLEPGRFFICTEATPRCFIIQQIDNVNRVLNQDAKSPMASGDGGAGGGGANLPLPASSGGEELEAKEANSVAALSTAAAVKSLDGGNSGAPTTHSAAGTSAAALQLPGLPWWFTNECRLQLLSIPSFEAFVAAQQNTAYTAATTLSRSATPDAMAVGAAATPEEQLRVRLKYQLEYYFSRENLVNDRYLRCQMDADQYVPIKIVAGFPKVAHLTDDYALIVDVLRSSPRVQVDESGEKVRPVTKRCTIILREIPPDASENEVKAMFTGCSPQLESIAYGLNNSWYVTFPDEEATKRAFLHLKNLGKTFNNKPIHARIKTGGAPGATAGATATSSASPSPAPPPLPGGGAPSYDPLSACVSPVPPMEKADVVSSTPMGQIIIHDITHHYHNNFLHVHCQQQQQQQQQQLNTVSSGEIGRSGTKAMGNGENDAKAGKSAAEEHGDINNKVDSDVVGSAPSAGISVSVSDAEGHASTLPSSTNLGLLLAQCGYVPRATFRPSPALLAAHAAVTNDSGARRNGGDGSGGSGSGGEGGNSTMAADGQSLGFCTETPLQFATNAGAPNGNTGFTASATTVGSSGTDCGGLLMPVPLPRSTSPTTYGYNGGGGGGYGNNLYGGSGVQHGKYNNGGYGTNMGYSNGGSGSSGYGSSLGGGYGRNNNVQRSHYSSRTSSQSAASGGGNSCSATGNPTLSVAVGDATTSMPKWQHARPSPSSAAGNYCKTQPPKPSCGEAATTPAKAALSKTSSAALPPKKSAKVVRSTVSGAVIGRRQFATATAPLRSAISDALKFWRRQSLGATAEETAAESYAAKTATSSSAATAAAGALLRRTAAFSMDATMDAMRKRNAAAAQPPPPPPPMPHLGRHRITDVPRMNRARNRSPPGNALPVNFLIAAAQYMAEMSGANAKPTTVEFSDGQTNSSYLVQPFPPPLPPMPPQSTMYSASGTVTMCPNGDILVENDAEEEEEPEEEENDYDDETEESPANAEKPQADDAECDDVFDETTPLPDCSGVGGGAALKRQLSSGSGSGGRRCCGGTIGVDRNIGTDLRRQLSSDSNLRRPTASWPCNDSSCAAAATVLTRRQRIATVSMDDEAVGEKRTRRGSYGSNGGGAAKTLFGSSTRRSVDDRASTTSRGGATDRRPPRVQRQSSRTPTLAESGNRFSGADEAGGATAITAAKYRRQSLAAAGCTKNASSVHYGKAPTTTAALRQRYASSTGNYGGGGVNSGSVIETTNQFFNEYTAIATDYDNRQGGAAAAKSAASARTINSGHYGGARKTNPGGESPSNRRSDGTYDQESYDKGSGARTTESASSACQHTTTTSAAALPSPSTASSALLFSNKNNNHINNNNNNAYYYGDNNRYKNNNYGRNGSGIYGRNNNNKWLPTAASLSGGNPMELAPISDTSSTTVDGMRLRPLSASGTPPNVVVVPAVATQRRHDFRNQHSSCYTLSASGAPLSAGATLRSSANLSPRAYPKAREPLLALPPQWAQLEPINGGAAAARLGADGGVQNSGGGYDGGRRRLAANSNPTTSAAYKNNNSNSTVGRIVYNGNNNNNNNNNNNDRYNYIDKEFPLLSENHGSCGGEDENSGENVNDYGRRVGKGAYDGGGGGAKTRRYAAGSAPRERGGGGDGRGGGGGGGGGGRGGGLSRQSVNRSSVATAASSSSSSTTAGGGNFAITPHALIRLVERATANNADGGGGEPLPQPPTENAEGATTRRSYAQTLLKKTPAK